MCTALSLIAKNNNVFFGRTMDFSYELDPEVYIVPRNYTWNNGINNCEITNKYKFIGIGQNIGNVTFADGTNELGLAGAVLYFPGYADYNSYDNKKNNIYIGSTDLINYILGNCSDINDTIKVLNSINITGKEDAITNSIAPLHWLFIDKNNNCITVEKTSNGLKIFNNELKVLANSPAFDWHMTNLRNYLNVNPNQLERVFWKDVLLSPFGQGAGTTGLPGDYTSPSRFVRTAFLKSFTSIPLTNDEAINTCFNIMKSVSIPRGVVITKRGTDDYTQYTAFMNINTGDYYFNTYSNNQILKANINSVNDNNIVKIGKIKYQIKFDTLRNL